jgi:hypothetical protein
MMEKSLTKKPAEKFHPSNTSNKYTRLGCALYSSAICLECHGKKPNSAAKPHILKFLNSSFLKGKLQNGRTLICTDQK